MQRLAMPEKIETERLLLQRFRPEDAEEIFFTYASKPEATRFVSFPTHQTIYDTRQYLDYATRAWNQDIDFSYSIRLRENQKMIGSFGVVHENGKVSFGYVLSPRHWGNGYATEACKKLMAILQANLTVFRIWTLVDCENVASVRVLIKSGLVQEARLEKWIRFPNQNNQPKDCFVYILPTMPISPCYLPK
jgi:RimJ/RimL family protein N-acetyltransferase